MKRYYLMLAMFLVSGITYSQTVDDALRYSKQNYNGTARSLSMGGAFGALGGDFSSLSINPAGIAVYRSSEFTFTPSIEYHESKNSGISEDQYSFTIGNVGYVHSSVPRVENKEGWQNLNFGIGYNRVANFNRKGFLFNLDSETSRLDDWAGLAGGTVPDDLYVFEEKLAYDVFLINADENLSYQSVLSVGDKMDQRKYIDEQGYIGEYLLSFGANYGHILYLGATMGIQDLYYKSTTSYTEMSISGNETSLENFTFREYLRNSGVGVNFKFGIIVKPINSLRLGVAIHTPTYYNIDEHYDTYMESQFDPDNPNGFPEDDNSFHAFGSESVIRSSYDFQTPFRAIFSGAFLIGKAAAISVDYEMVDYADAEFDDAPSGDFIELNQNISRAYRSTSNLRGGVEFRVTPNLSLRGGYARYGDPYKGVVDEGYETYSGGFGLRQNNFFFDVGYQFTEFDEDFIFYPNSRTVTLNNTNHQLRMTFGFKF